MWLLPVGGGVVHMPCMAHTHPSLPCVCAAPHHQLTAGTPFVSYTQAQGLTTLSFCRPLSAPGIHDINTQGPTTAVFAFGSLGSNTFSRHPDGHRQVRVRSDALMTMWQG
jgi:hypothetical protein